MSEPDLFINAEDIAWAYRTAVTPMSFADEHRLARVILNLHALNVRLAATSPNNVPAAADPLAEALRAEAEHFDVLLTPKCAEYLADRARDFIAAEIDALTPVGEFGYREGYLDALGVAVRTAKGGPDE
jgi:hypothetical protein